MGKPNGHNMGSQSSGKQSATFSGATALTAIIACILEIIVTAVPNWGYYRPATGISFISGGYNPQDGDGHFGPFQNCKYATGYSYCGTSSHFKHTQWLTGAGICAIGALVCLALLSFFSCLHVAMQLQRQEIMVKFSVAVFLKVMFAAIAVVMTVLSVILASLHFSYGSRNSGLAYDMGPCYYIQIVLIVVCILLVVMSYLSYRKARRDPLTLVPRGGTSSVHYDASNSNGVSMTTSSGHPYSVHGQPRLPNQAQPQRPSYGHQQQQQHHQVIQPISIQQPGVGGGYVNNGFTPVTLSVPSMPQAQPHTGGHVTIAGQPVPMQPMRPIQPVQGIPQSPMVSMSQGPPASVHGGVVPAVAGGVPAQVPVAHASINLNPGGRSSAGHMGGGGKMSGAGSMESLNSTNSTMSNLSYGSTISTGSAHGPLRSSLKKSKNKDKASVSSESSSKRVRLSVGSEQTQV